MVVENRCISFCQRHPRHQNAINRVHNLETNIICSNIRQHTAFYDCVKWKSTVFPHNNLHACLPKPLLLNAMSPSIGCVLTTEPRIISTKIANSRHFPRSLFMQWRRLLLIACSMHSTCGVLYTVLAGCARLPQQF